MKLKKYMAFTLAELMIMLSVLTVMLAAFAPVFTVRYNNASATENIWSYIAGDDNNDAYSNQIGQLLTSQFFVGISPADKWDVSNSIKDTNNNVLYSKLVVRASDKLAKGLQHQFKFLYDGGTSPTGKGVASLFAGNGNFMLIDIDFKHKLQPRDVYTTLLGYGPTEYDYDNLSYSTRLGSSIILDAENNRNTVVTHNDNFRKVQLTDSTVIGNNSAAGAHSRGITVVGGNSGNVQSGHKGTTVVGANSFNLSRAGDYNTILGYNVLNSAHEIGSNNTIIGSRAGALITGSNKTVIGSRALSDTTISNIVKNELVNDSQERIFIGGKPKSFEGGSILEIHNMQSYTIGGLGSSNTTGYTPFNFSATSVLINGNLVIRGQSFLTAPAGFYYLKDRDLVDGTPALTAFSVIRPKRRTHARIFGGVDGNNFSLSLYGRRGRRHAAEVGHVGCVCAHACGSKKKSLQSYDWVSHPTSGADITDKNYSDGFGRTYGGSWRDISTSETCSYFSTPNGANYESGGSAIFMNKAHIELSNPNAGCCPDLRSDIRLKNLGDEFFGGIDSLKKLSVYNFTFKNDKSETPQVGVMAQDLKMVFPTAVSKDEKGYYKIRWDEMLYSAINAIKELNYKIVNLVDKVERDRTRISSLKADNKVLEQKLEALSEEITKLEKERK